MSQTTKGESRSAPRFEVPNRMTPAEVGDSLARLVWESFSDFVANGDTEIPLTDLGVARDEDVGLPEAHVTEEALIFLLWAHTRGAQLAFVGRGPEALVRSSLDALHRAVFEDMVENGTPRAHLPIFEQRVSARYTEFNQAAKLSDRALGDAVVRHITGRSDANEALARAMSERAIAVTEPLRDFLADVELTEG